MIPGIDLGNSRTKVAIPDAMGSPKLLTNRMGEPYTHSVVYWKQDGVPIVGTEAMNLALADPSRAVFNWKRHMGTDTVLFSDKGRDFIAKDVAAIILKEVKQDIEAKTGEVVNEVVISIPANYNDVQKQHTIDAAAEAGMKVLILTNEPTAAALGNDIHKKSNMTVLVFDLGGSTFDVSILEVDGNLISTVTTNGEPQLGGQDFNSRVRDKVLEAFRAKHKFMPTPEQHPVFYQDLEQRVEQAKNSLSVQQQYPLILSCEGKLLNMTITRDQFNGWTKELREKAIAKTQQTIREASRTWNDIDVTLIVGGGSAIPQIAIDLETISGKKVGRNCESMYAAAYGNVISGRIEYERQNRPYPVGTVTLPPMNIHLREILSHSIGVMALNEHGQETCCTILSKSTPIPSSYTSMFKLTEPNQTDASIRILEGDDGAKAADCLMLGHFDLKGMPPRPDLIGRIEITYHLDSSGMLKATARDIVSGKNEELTIEYKNANGMATSAA